MSIHILDTETIDKIAAGEVVERPSSVVKELVENAMDAGATSITVEAKDGGIEFIRVTDNGSGMAREQIRTAFLRHATSKIENADDLTRIVSLGFRGEALSSIAAVSKVELITKTGDSLTGNRMILEAAVEKSFEEIGAPEGTTFLVRNLFYNTPVRRKFLKQPATEGGYIADLMEHLALSRPDISFKFVLGNQTKFHTSGNGDLREVIYRIYGREVTNALVPIQFEQDGVRIDGFLGKPIMVRSNRNYEIYFINGRFIRSNIVAKAIEEGYKEYLMQHKFPFCVLHIAIDPECVDVNVHPTKMDVRFSDGMIFYNLLAGAIREALKAKEMIPDATLDEKKMGRTANTNTDEPASGNRKAGTRTVGSSAHSTGGRAHMQAPEPFEVKREADFRVREESRYQAEASVPKQKNEFAKSPVWSRIYMDSEAGETPLFSPVNAKENVTPSVKPCAVLPVKENIQAEICEAAEEDDFFVEAPIPQEVIVETCAESKAQENAPDADNTKLSARQSPKEVTRESPVQEHNVQIEKPQQMNFFEEKMLTVENRSRYHIIGQIFDTYWLVQFEDKLFIIDQHAAHEKVKYERLMKQYHEKQIVSQTLMPPIIISLSGQEQAVLNGQMEAFSRLGFEVESFGGSEYALRSVPVDLYGCGERELFLEVLDELTEGNGIRGNITSVEEKIASMSCKAAVKGNNRLSMTEAEKLIDELLTLENPYNCPHGRPTIISMSKIELEKKFKRIV